MAQLAILKVQMCTFSDRSRATFNKYFYIEALPYPIKIFLHILNQCSYHQGRILKRNIDCNVITFQKFEFFIFELLLEIFAQLSTKRISNVCSFIVKSESVTNHHSYSSQSKQLNSNLHYKSFCLPVIN